MEQEPNILSQVVPKKPMPLWSVVLMLIGAMLLLVIGTTKVALEQKAFVDKCNAHWLRQISIAYPKTNYPWQEWNATPTGLTSWVIGAAEQTGLNLTSQNQTHQPPPQNQNPPPDAYPEAS